MKHKKRNISRVGIAFAIFFAGLLIVVLEAGAGRLEKCSNYPKGLIGTQRWITECCPRFCGNHCSMCPEETKKKHKVRKPRKKTKSKKDYRKKTRKQETGIKKKVPQAVTVQPVVKEEKPRLPENPSLSEAVLPCIGASGIQMAAGQWRDANTVFATAMEESGGNRMAVKESYDNLRDAHRNLERAQISLARCLTPQNAFINTDADKNLFKQIAIEKEEKEDVPVMGERADLMLLYYWGAKQVLPTGKAVEDMCKILGRRIDSLPEIIRGDYKGLFTSCIVKRLSQLDIAGKPQTLYYVSPPEDVMEARNGVLATLTRLSDSDTTGLMAQLQAVYEICTEEFSEVSKSEGAALDCDRQSTRLLNRCSGLFMSPDFHALDKTRFFVLQMKNFSYRLMESSSAGEIDMWRKAILESLYHQSMNVRSALLEEPQYNYSDTLLHDIVHQFFRGMEFIMLPAQIKAKFPF